MGKQRLLAVVVALAALCALCVGASRDAWAEAAHPSHGHAHAAPHVHKSTGKAARPRAHTPNKRPKDAAPAKQHGAHGTPGTKTPAK